MAAEDNPPKPKVVDAQDADALREQGTAKFKAKEYEAAIELYTRSLELNPNDHRCYSNRCASYCCMRKDLEQALADAQKCVEMKPDWAKGYHRVFESLKFLKRAGEAKPWLEKGLETCPDEDKPDLEKKLKEVPNLVFKQQLQGTWHGTVNEVLGGYDQEMEFLENNEEVRIDVLGRSIVGKYWVDVTKEPFHMNIQVPQTEVPPGMPPPPPVPYIARIDSVGLHLCCPYLKMERPSEFTGPGYVLMKSGALSQDDDAEVANLSRKDKLLRCSQELLKAMPNREIVEPSPSDSEEAAGEKMMMQVRFESTMYQIQRRFGEDMVKEIIGFVRENKVPPELEGAQDIQQLADKMKVAGLFADPQSEAGPAPKATMAKEGPRPSPPPPAQQAAEKAPAVPSHPPSASRGEASDSSGDSQSCTFVVGGVLAAGALAAAAAFMMMKKTR